MIREVAPKVLEHGRRARPVAHLDQRGGRVVLGRRTNRRGRRGLANTQEVADGRVVRAGAARLLALLVDRRRDALDDLGALGVGGRNQRAELHVGGLRGREVGEVELRVREHGPRSALQIGLDRRRARDDLLRDVARAREIVEREQLLGRVGLHARRLLVGRIALREPQRAVDALTMPLGALRAAQLVLVLRVREQRRVARLAAVLMERVRVSGALVLERRVAEAAALVQHFGEQEIRLRRILVVGERLLDTSDTSARPTRTPPRRESPAPAA